MKNLSDISSKPHLSVVLIAFPDYKIIKKTLDHLYDQDNKEFIELLIISDIKADISELSEKLSAFHSYKNIYMEDIISTGYAIAKGYLNASAEIVTYCEEHSYPQKGWANSIIKAHSDGWAAVGWAIDNYNPKSIISWANIYSSFGSFIIPVKSGEQNKLATHHVSYKKSIIEDYGDDLGELLENELILLIKLKKNGGRFFFESKAVSKHVNITKYSICMYSDYLGGQVYTAYKVKYLKMSVLKRILFVLASPIRPIAKVTRVLINVLRTRRYYLLPWIIPVLILPAYANSFGEVLGYISGEGDTSDKRRYVELDRTGTNRS